MPYPNQVIVELLTGVGNASVQEGSLDMRAKWVNQGLDEDDSPIVSVNAQDVSNTGVPSFRVRLKLQRGLKRLDADSRLYIRGHGWWGSQTCAGLSGEQVARLLASCGLSTVKLVSVTACRGAIGGLADEGAAYMSLANSSKSFAGKLHWCLGDNHSVRTVLHGRVGKVSISGQRARRDMIGRKATRLLGPDDAGLGAHPGKFVGHQSRSKIRFYWDGSTQKMEWVDYGPGGNYDIVAREFGFTPEW